MVDPPCSIPASAIHAGASCIRNTYVPVRRYSTIHTVGASELSVRIDRSRLSLFLCPAMGINDMMKYLPGGSEYFTGLQASGLDGKPVNLDAGSLLWSCANAHAAEYLQGNYRNSAMLFQSHLNYYKVVRK
jgi:hypothetical protein